MWENKDIGIWDKKIKKKQLLDRFCIVASN